MNIHATSATALRRLSSALVGALVALLMPLSGDDAGATASKHGITPLAPKAGAMVPAGQPTTLAARVRRGRGPVYFHVCSKKDKDRTGRLCHDAALGRANGRRKGRVFTYTPQMFSFPTFWLNAPGVYYWQAVRISCSGGDCFQEGPIVRFSVG